MSPACFAAPSVGIRHFGRSFGGFFSDYAATMSIDEPWGEGSLSWGHQPHTAAYWRHQQYGGDRVSMSHLGPHGS